jgi:hypothetical protein
MTVAEHDTAELKQLFQQTAISIAILAFLHVKFGYVQPLILQSLFPFKNLFSSPLAKIHLLGRKDVNELKRPWPKPNPFGYLALT